MDLTINGKVVRVDAEPDMPLLWALRDKLSMTGTKYGCGMALCGACTVHVDGQPTRACVTPVSAVAGRRIVTIEAVASSRAGKAGGSRSSGKPWPDARSAYTISLADSAACGSSGASGSAGKFASIAFR